MKHIHTSSWVMLVHGVCTQLHTCIYLHVLCYIYLNCYLVHTHWSIGTWRPAQQTPTASCFCPYRLRSKCYSSQHCRQLALLVTQLPLLISWQAGLLIYAQEPIATTELAVTYLPSFALQPPFYSPRQAGLAGTLPWHKHSNMNVCTYSIRPLQRPT